MAKVVKDEDQVLEEVVVAGTAEGSEPEVKPVVLEEALVEVTPKQSGRRYIAGVWYEFTKDKPIKVTREAKRVLKEAGFIYI